LSPSVRPDRDRRVSAGQIKWFESFSIPGYSAYEANQRTLKAFGSGLNTPLVAVVTTKGDVTKRPGSEGARRSNRSQPGRALESYFSTGSDTYVSKDKHTTIAEIYRQARRLRHRQRRKETRAALRGQRRRWAIVHVTGTIRYSVPPTRGQQRPSILARR